MGAPSRPIPVVLDTDIGTDIDDTWALAMMLRCPELAPRLVLTASGDTSYRARLAAAVLAAAGRDRVPLGIGPSTSLPPGTIRRPQAQLADSVDLDAYLGTVHADGVAALVDCVMGSPERVTVIAIGPMTNVAAALAAEPRIVENARLVAMLGSVRKGHFDSPAPEREYNVLCDVPACRAVLAADWEVTITPLDTCSTVLLSGERYEAIRRSPDPLLRTVMDTYREWVEASADQLDGYGDDVHGADMVGRCTSLLYDTVAVYLAYEESLLEIERLPLAVEDDGMTRVSPGAPEVRVATAWRGDGFLDHLADRLLDLAVAP